MTTKCLWEQIVGDYHVCVHQLPSGQYLSSTGLKAILDPYGSSNRCETFDDVIDAYKFVGFPVYILPLPHLQEKENGNSYL